MRTKCLSMKTNEFKTYHPIINFIYFVFVIVCTCVFMHPLYLAVSFLSAIVFLKVLGDKVFKKLLYMLLLGVFMVLVNVLFNHQGVTVLFYLKNSNAITLESLIYGGLAAVMIISVIFHFSCYSIIMTSDRFLYLFGKTAPSLSLIFSMTLRFVPQFKREIKEAEKARQVFEGKNKRGIKEKIKEVAVLFSAAAEHSLENSADTALSLKARGYGRGKRSSFSIFKFDMRDFTMLILLLFLAGYVFIGAVLGELKFLYFPEISFQNMTLYSWSILFCYTLFCFMPCIIEAWEVRKWKVLKLKI